MVDASSLIVSIISLVGAVLSAGFTGWITFYMDIVKRRAEAKALTDKYRDPLTLSAYDLQSRLFGLVGTNLLNHLEDTEKKRSLLQMYTGFLIGQYFSWAYIFRRQAQFLRFSTDKTNKQLTRIMDRITDEFAQDRPGENAFMLWRGQQMAIGEVMTLDENGQLHCMGFAAFSAKYDEEPVFKKWFQSIEDGVLALGEARAQKNDVATNKLRRLQHLLIDLVLLLDSELIASSDHPRPKTRAAPACRCIECPGTDSSSITSKKNMWSGGKKA